MARSETNLYFGYKPTLGPAVLFLVLWFLVSVCAIVRIHKSRLKYFIIFAVGAVGEMIGFVARAAVVHNLDSLGNFVVMDLFLVLSPLAFMAADYVLYGRMIVLFDQEAPFLRRIARVFVICDISSLIVQALGSSFGLIYTDNSGVNMQELGKWISVAAFIFTLLTFTFYSCLVTVFFRRLVRLDRSDQSISRSLPLWRRPFIPLYISVVLITIRNTYRLVEFATGFNGPVRSVEWPVYVFDTLPMLLLAVGYMVIWPASYGITQAATSRIAPKEDKMGLVQTKRETAKC